MMRDQAILKLIDQGLTAYGLGNLEEALAAWQNVLAIDPDNVRARDYITFIEKHRAPTPQDVAGPTSPSSFTPPAKSILKSNHWGDIYDGQATPSNKADAAAQLRPPPAPVPNIQPSTLPPRPAAPLATTPMAPEGASALDLVDVKTQPQPIQATQDQTPSEALLKSAQDRMALNDFSGAMELLDSLLSQEPNHQKARLMHEEASQQLIKMLFSKLGDLNRVPRVSMRGDEIIWLNLDHRAGFVLSLVDGTLSFDDILLVCGLSQLEGTRILVQLLQNNVITAE
jgi:tetratricopeptide (TPR) repeat protein